MSADKEKQNLANKSTRMHGYRTSQFIQHGRIHGSLCWVPASMDIVEEYLELGKNVSFLQEL